MKRRGKIPALMRYLTVPTIALVVAGGLAMSAFRSSEPVAVAPAVMAVVPEAEAPLRPSFLAPGARLDEVPVAVAADSALEAAPMPPAASEPPVRVVATLAVEPVQAPEAVVPQDRVGDSAVNVRSGPSNRNAKLFVLMPGEPVEVAGSDGGWLQVTTPDGRSGWVYSKYIRRQDPAAQ